MWPLCSGDRGAGPRTPLQPLHLIDLLSGEKAHFFFPRERGPAEAAGGWDRLQSGRRGERDGTTRPSVCLCGSAASDLFLGGFVTHIIHCVNSSSGLVSDGEVGGSNPSLSLSQFKWLNQCESMRGGWLSGHGSISQWLQMKLSLAYQQPFKSLEKYHINPVY